LASPSIRLGPTRASLSCPPALAAACPLLPACQTAALDLSRPPRPPADPPARCRALWSKFGRCCPLPVQQPTVCSLDPGVANRGARLRVARTGQKALGLPPSDRAFPPLIPPPDHHTPPTRPLSSTLRRLRPPPRPLSPLPVVTAPSSRVFRRNHGACQWSREPARQARPSSPHRRRRAPPLHSTPGEQAALCDGSDSAFDKRSERRPTRSTQGRAASAETSPTAAERKAHGARPKLREQA
jgi:hypothetical protein